MILLWEWGEVFDMSGKEKIGVVYWFNCGRSVFDSKSKIDFGCFLDDEIERNGSSDSSYGFISFLLLKEKVLKKYKVVNKES